MLVYLSRKAEGIHSSNLFVGKLMNCFTKAKINYTHKIKDNWDVGLVLINSNEPTLFNKGPIVQRLDGIYFNTDDKSMKSNIGIKNTYQKSAGVIFQSALAKNIVSKNFGPPPKENTVIINGTIIDHLCNPKELLTNSLPKLMAKISRFDKKIICVGKWRQIKRLSSIVKGFIEYQRTNNNACLIIVGPIDDKERALFDKKYPNIICVGHVDNNSVRHLQMISDVCLNLSFTDSCPSAVIEAIANGTPCVVTKNQGIIEIMKNNEDGVILDVDDWDYMPISYNRDIKEIDSVIVADAIAKCVKMGRHSFRHDLSMSITADKYIQFLKKCARK